MNILKEAIQGQSNFYKYFFGLSLTLLVILFYYEDKYIDELNESIPYAKSDMEILEMKKDRTLHEIKILNIQYKELDDAIACFTDNKKPLPTRFKECEIQHDLSMEEVLIKYPERLKQTLEFGKKSEKAISELLTKRADLEVLMYKAKKLKNRQNYLPLVKFLLVCACLFFAFHWYRYFNIEKNNSED